MSLIQIAHQSSRDVAPPRAPAAHAIGRAQQRIPRPELVARVSALLSENVGEPVTVTELSGLVGVSQRTLRAAFRDVLGLSPKQYAIKQRLRAAREALSAADPQTTTVTEIAMTYGFFELGRFAGRYRQAFGEAPSRTLRHVAASWPGEAA